MFQKRALYNLNTSKKSLALKNLELDNKFMMI